ncbi:MAG: 50S ribosomal protein L19 [Candidatus Omnitrophica bacterium]|nr:50S ribosomal protein L19 [Candidatus Omnitrophota bacterium]
MDKLRQFEKTLETKEMPKFNIGDTVVVSIKIREEDKTRIQDFEGVVIRKKGTGIRSVFTVRRISYGEGVERTFPLYSPGIDRIKVKKKGKTRRAKLYYLRKKVGKKGRLDEKIEKEKTSEKNALPRGESS